MFLIWKKSFNQISLLTCGFAFCILHSRRPFLRLPLRCVPCRVRVDWKEKFILFYNVVWLKNRLKYSLLSSYHRNIHSWCVFTAWCPILLHDSSYSWELQNGRVSFSITNGSSITYHVSITIWFLFHQKWIRCEVKHGIGCFKGTINGRSTFLL